MSNIQHILLPILLSFIGTLWIHPKILKIAILKNLVDNPDARKLQRNPVPVMVYAVHRQCSAAHILSC